MAPSSLVTDPCHFVGSWDITGPCARPWATLHSTAPRALEVRLLEDVLGCTVDGNAVDDDGCLIPKYVQAVQTYIDRLESDRSLKMQAFPESAPGGGCKGCDGCDDCSESSVAILCAKPTFGPHQAPYYSVSSTCTDLSVFLPPLALPKGARKLCALAGVAVPLNGKVLKFKDHIHGQRRFHTVRFMLDPSAVTAAVAAIAEVNNRAIKSTGDAGYLGQNGSLVLWKEGDPRPKNVVLVPERACPKLVLLLAEDTKRHWFTVGPIFSSGPHAPHGVVCHPRATEKLRLNALGLVHRAIEHLRTTAYTQRANGGLTLSK
jgi:hypothetical protein